MKDQRPPGHVTVTSGLVLTPITILHSKTQPKPQLDSPRIKRRRVRKRIAGAQILPRMNVERRLKVGANRVVNGGVVEPVEEIECVEGYLQVPRFSSQCDPARNAQVKTPKVWSNAGIPSRSDRTVGRIVTVTVEIRAGQQAERSRTVGPKNWGQEEISNEVLHQ